MLKAKLSHSNIYAYDVCSCGNKTECSSTYQNRKVASRKYTSVNNGLITKPRNATKRIPGEFWKEQTNLRQFFDELGKKIGIAEPDDWYQTLSSKVFSQHGGGSLLAGHKSSPITALMTAYPEHNWIPWKFNIVNRGYWSNLSNQRKFFDDLGLKLGIQKQDDWYQKLSAKVITEHGGVGLLAKRKHSPMAALMSVYPEHNWDPSKFKKRHQGYWSNRANQKKFFDDLALKLNVEKLDDWYHKLSQEAMIENGGTGLLAKYKNSPMASLMAAYPEHNWDQAKFKQLHQGYWNNKDNQKKFFDGLALKLGVENLDDWYQKLTQEIIITNGGAGLLRTHRNSPIEALMAAYPEHNWIPWKFNSITKGFWNSPSNNIKDFLSELSEKLSIQTLDDWYRVDLKQLQLFGASTIITKYKGLYNVLKEQYPNHPWDPKKFKQVGKKAQKWLAVTLKKMFPNEEILEDYMHPKATLANRPLQLDVFIPSRSLAFEYQGEQHYEDVGVFSPSRIYQQRDEEKRNLCAANNIKLIEVPYWWNRTQESLQEMINKA